MITNIKDNNDNLLAIIVSNETVSEGIKFFTSEDNNLQVGMLGYTTGTRVDAHLHKDNIRTIKGTQEVVIIKKGQYRADFYDEEKIYIKSYILKQNDVIIFIQGCHGFKSIEDVELIEIKQGPFLKDHDKTRFKGIEDEEVVF